MVVSAPRIPGHAALTGDGRGIGLIIVARHDKDRPGPRKF